MSEIHKNSTNIASLAMMEKAKKETENAQKLLSDAFVHRERAINYTILGKCSLAKICIERAEDLEKEAFELVYIVKMYTEIARDMLTKI
jgi:hypothetical protein